MQLQSARRVQTLLAAVATGLTIFAAANRAHAWESRCYEYADDSLEPTAYSVMTRHDCSPDAGPNIARNRWIGPLDEHRQIWEVTRGLAGLPDSLASTVRLRVFAGTGAVMSGGVQIATIAPVAFEQTTRAYTRAFTVGEIAQLPDFSYSLFDWVLGNETCPLAGVSADPIDCHRFTTHMGSVNANHFLPQAQNFYRRYHEIALARASECRALQSRLASAGNRFDDYVRACETEALVIESVAQHYLQDGWSTGHMWQRWGSPDLTDAPGATAEERRARALLVALASGLVHGARGILQALPGWTTYDVNDAMCAPNDAVRFVSGSHIEHGVGDDYLSVLLPPAGQTLPPPQYAFQYQRMMECGAAGMIAVYQATAQRSGPLRADAAMAHPSLDPLGADCWGQRDTNAALLTGAGVQFRVLGRQEFLTMDARFVSWALPTVGTTAGHAEIDPLLRAQYRFDLGRAVTLLRILARTSPDGTEGADGGLGDVMGIHPNGAYAQRAVIASYVDPGLPWPATRDTATPDAQARAQALARMFHKAHVGDWCNSLGARDLEALRSHARATAQDPAARPATCEVCAEFAMRHLRVGAANGYDTAREPVCRFVGTAPAFVYQPARGSDDVATLARSWCGCN